MGNASVSNDHPISKTNLYELVTSKVISMIEQGIAPWRRTWNEYGLARNYVTGHIYTGINLLLMNNIRTIPYFMSFNQVKEKRGKIKKGSKAEMVFYFNVFYKDRTDQTLTKEEASHRTKEGDEIQILKFLKYYNVFNIEDTEGIEFEISKLDMRPNQKIERCEKILWNMPKIPMIVSNKGSGPFYSPSHDFINMPEKGHFQSSEAYYAVLFHELIHSTGHESRLNREGVTNPILFGSDLYSREEIVAEMGASYLCSSAWIDYDRITENSASYLVGWLKVLKEDSKFIFKAAAEAQKAADYILDWRLLDGD